MAEPEEFRRAASDWIRANLRDLPWRSTRDPWKILVAETMLQQTQVTRVIPKWEAFLAEFPTAAATADGSLTDVLRLWSGLGYNRRAVQLHRCAQVIADLHGGRVPDQLPLLLALPGVGSYTARAVLVFAFERDAAVLDTNVARVAARAIAGQPLSQKAAQETIDALVPTGKSWEWNQGMLDLGALVCTKRAPRCGACPVRSVCAWSQSGFPAPDPAFGSAAVSGGQSRFAGSDRQGRGRLLKALLHEPVSLAALPEALGWPDDPGRSDRVLAGLLRDGLVELYSDSVHLATRSTPIQHVASKTDAAVR